MKIGLDRRYLCAALVVLLLETAIALSMDSGFVREYVGDVLVVVLVYCLVRSFARTTTRLLPLYVLAFAVLVEVLQGLGLVELLGLGDVAVARAVLGTTFDLADIGCYVVGCAALTVFEMVVRTRRGRARWHESVGAAGPRNEVRSGE